MDLEELLESWGVSLRAEHLSLPYLRLCEGTVRLYIRSGYGELTKKNAEEWIGGIKEHGTANVRARCLKRFSKWLSEEGETETDVLAGFKPPAAGEGKLVPKMDDKDIRAMLKSCEGRKFRSVWDAALIVFGLETGARASEVLNLRLVDVDMSRMIAIIISGKGGRSRVVPFSPVTAKYLDRYMRARRRHPKASSEWLWLGGGPVEDGEGKKITAHLTYGGMAASLSRRASEAGVEGFHYHRLRHSMASRWLAAGGSEGGLMAVAGWRNRQMIDRYARDTAAERAITEARSLGLAAL